jgi:hypothetical protein
MSDTPEPTVPCVICGAKIIVRLAILDDDECEQAGGPVCADCRGGRSCGSGTPRRGFELNYSSDNGWDDMIRAIDDGGRDE